MSARVDGMELLLKFIRNYKKKNYSNKYMYIASISYLAHQQQKT